MSSHSSTTRAGVAGSRHPIPHVSLRARRPTPCRDLIAARRSIRSGGDARKQLDRLRATHPDEATRDVLVGKVNDMESAARAAWPCGMRKAGGAT